jgi:hypothetical protein
VLAVAFLIVAIDTFHGGFAPTLPFGTRDTGASVVVVTFVVGALRLDFAVVIADRCVPVTPRHPLTIRRCARDALSGGVAVAIPGWAASSGVAEAIIRVKNLPHDTLRALALPLPYLSQSGINAP